MYQLKPSSFLQLASLIAFLTIGLAGSHQQAVGQTVRFETNVGDIEVQLHPNDAPIAVANFLSYVNAPAGSNYEDTFFHRSISNFIVQGGGFYAPVNGVANEVPTQAPIVNEFGISNTRGTIAFAKMGGDPDSATNQWFFNTADNSANLDAQNGGFTVFGSVVSGMNVVDAIQATPTYNLDAADPGVFDNVPLINNASDFIVVNSISVVTVLLGDVNLDGAVTFADIPAFIALLTNGTFQNEADCDQSATVDFGDIPAFIAILIG